MSLKKKKVVSRTKNYFFEQKMRAMKKILDKKSKLTAENINLILEHHFLTLELLKFNLFGEDFENYGNIVINGETYYPHKLSLDYLAKQETDEIKNLNIDFDILNSLKKADDINILNSRKLPINIFKNFATSKHNKISRNKSMTNIKTNKYSNLMHKDLSLPKIKIKNINHHMKLNLASNYTKVILLKNFPEPISSINSKNFLLTKNSYMKRYGEANKLKEKLNFLENRYKNIETGIKNDLLINKEKTPQLQFRYKYVESKFKI